MRPVVFQGHFSPIMSDVESFKAAPANCRSFLVCALILLLPSIALAKAKPKTASGTIDPDYVAALATANRFLHAWQVQDHETGVLMLTDSAKQHLSEDRLDAFFSAGEATAEGFEIARGKKLQAWRYRFPVALWQTVSGKKSKPHSRFSEIIVVRTGKDEWAIDKLP